MYLLFNYTTFIIIIIILWTLDEWESWLAIKDL